MKAKTITLMGAIFAVIAVGSFVLSQREKQDLPLVAIANYGPHSSLEDTITGLKTELAMRGYIEGKTIRYATADVNFEPILIPQMLSALRAKQPAVLVTQTTPVSQAAKQTVKNIPIVFTDIHDPVAAGLIGETRAPEASITGASDKQDLDVLLAFIKKLLPQAKSIGMLYCAAEANDAAQIKLMEAAAKRADMALLAVPVDQARDVPMRMQLFNGKVDCLYVGMSGPIQPALPAIAAQANRMNIPVFNANETAVKEDLVLGSMGVNYDQVGHITGAIVAQILEGASPKDIPIAYPAAKDHIGFISKKEAKRFGIALPAHLDNVTLVN